MLLADVAEAFLVAFTTEFVYENVEPKMHFTVHYGNHCHMFGPLIQHQSFHFECKHAYFKELSCCMKCHRMFYWQENTSTIKVGTYSIMLLCHVMTFPVSVASRSLSLNCHCMWHLHCCQLWVATLMYSRLLRWLTAFTSKCSLAVITGFIHCIFFLVLCIISFNLRLLWFRHTSTASKRFAQFQQSKRTTNTSSQPTTSLKSWSKSWWSRSRRFRSRQHQCKHMRVWVTREETKYTQLRSTIRWSIMQFARRSTVKHHAYHERHEHLRYETKLGRLAATKQLQYPGNDDQ